MNAGFPPGALEQALNAVVVHGSIAAAARALGLPYSTVERRYKAAKVDPALAQAMNAVGTDMVPTLAWVKTPAKDGEPAFSVLLKPQETPDDVLERIRAALEGMTPAAPVVAPETVMADLCAVYPLMDVHLGMHAWGRETGAEDYDLSLAGQDMRRAFDKVLALTPAADTAVLLVGGDYFHADDDRNETPANKHKLDVDGRFLKVIDTGIALLGEAVERLREKHRRIIVRVLRGNHDPHACHYLTFALAERYRHEPRIEVQKDPRDLFMFQWGRSAIFAHHGDRAKPEQIALYLSDVVPFWSETRHRHFFSGHVHKDQVKDLGSLLWESVRPFCPPDAYAAGMGYVGRRRFQAVVFDRQDGLVLRALDPIERTNS